MAISLSDWLKDAGKDQAWFDALPPAQQKVVRKEASDYPSPGSTRESLGAGKPPEDVAAEVDAVVAKRPQDAKVKADTEAALPAWLEQHGKSIGWYDGLSPDLQLKVRREYQNSKKFFAPGNVESDLDAIAGDQRRADEQRAQQAQKQPLGRATEGQVVPSPTYSDTGATTPLEKQNPYDVPLTPQASEYFASLLGDETAKVLVSSPTPADKPASNQAQKNLREERQPTTIQQTESLTVEGGKFLNAFIHKPAADVMRWQRRLLDAGYQVNVNGDPTDPSTLTALASIIKTAQLTNSSIATTIQDKTLAAHTGQVSDVPFGADKWDEGRVKAYQQKLIAAGFNVTASGVLDEQTIAALKQLKIETGHRGNDLDAALEQDKTISDTERQAAREKAAKESYRNQLDAAHIAVWGVPAPQAKLDQAEAAGFNPFEFETHLRSDPLYLNSPMAAEKQASIERQLADQFGFLGGAGVAGSF